MPRYWTKPKKKKFDTAKPTPEPLEVTGPDRSDTDTMLISTSRTTFLPEKSAISMAKWILKQYGYDVSSVRRLPSR